jgi:hypothetical protein
MLPSPAWPNIRSRLIEPNISFANPPAQKPRPYRAGRESVPSDSVFAWVWVPWATVSASRQPCPVEYATVRHTGVESRHLTSCAKLTRPRIREDRRMGGARRGEMDW